MVYRIKIEKFEGPLDLLLDLIEKEKMDITEVSLSKVADQYLAYIEQADVIDPSNLADFLSVAAKLILLKSKALLPELEIDDEDEESIEDLKYRLQEYKRFKDAAAEISVYETNRRKLFSRKSFEKYFVKKEISTEDYLNDISLFDLLLALKKALDNMPKITEHQVTRIDVTIEQQTEFILEKFTSNKAILFSELIKKIQEKIVIIVTFMALLDLINKKQLTVKQSKNFDDIRIKMIN